MREPLDQVFPGARKTLSSLGEGNQDLLKAAAGRDNHITSELERAGLDVDAALLFELLQHEPEKRGFVVFDSGSKRIGMNSKHLLVWQFLFDANYGQNRKEDQSKSHHEDEGNLNFYLADGTRLGFDVDGDEEKYDVEVENEDSCECQMLMLNLEEFGEDQDIIVFTDLGGETDFLRTSEVALVEIDLSAVDPDLNEDEESGVELSLPTPTVVQ